MIDFRLVSLSEVLEPANRWFAPELTTSYRQIGVRLWGQGAYEREQVTGAGTKYERLNLCKTGDIVVNKIWARSGSVAVVDQQLDGSVVSNEFPLFTAKQVLLDPDWFRLFTQTPNLWNQCDQLARGTSGQNRIRPENFLRVQIPLPSLADQREVVTKVDIAFKKLDEGRRLATSMAEDFDRLLIAMAHRNDLTDVEKAAQGWRRVQLGEVMRLDLDPVKVDPSDEYPNLGIYSYAKGAFGKPSLAGISLAASTLFRVRTGQFIYLKLNAYEGAYASVPADLDGYFVTNEFPTFTCDPTKCRSEWLVAHFKLPSVWRSMSHSSKGTPTRRQRVNPNAILAHELWLPPMAEQNKIAEVLNAKRQYDALDTFEKDAEALRRSILSKAFRGEL